MDRIVRQHRISVDQDSDNQFQLLKKYFNMKNITSNVKLMKTGHGYHVLGEFRDRTPKQNMDIRRMLCDCRNRIELDEGRLRYGLPELIETLFYEKSIDGKVTDEEFFNILSMPFWGNGLKWSKRT